MKLKKFAALAAALAMALSLAACGTESGETAEADITATSAATETVKDETDTEKDETAAEKQEETTVSEETTTEETTTTEEVTEPAEPEYQIPDWDSIDYADELDFITEDVDGGVAITEYLGTDLLVKIPETIDGKKVVQIGTAYIADWGSMENTQSPFKKATDVKLPNGITKVDMCAFNKCEELKSVLIPDGVKVIDQWAFSECSNLESVNIPNGVNKIGHGAFSNCIILKNITIPDSVTKISNWAFYNCFCLKSINIPEKVTNIGFGAFAGCASITELTFPKNVTFDNGDYEWTENYIPILLAYTSIKSIDIPNGVTYIGNVDNDSAFYYCLCLETVTIPNTVTELGADAFRNCTGLKSVIIPDSVTKIGENAFYYCTSLKSITIPDSVTEIDEKAFDSCSEDLEVTYGGTTYKYNQLPNLYSKING